MVSTPQTRSGNAKARTGGFLSGWRLDTVLGTGRDHTVFLASDRNGQEAAIRLVHSSAPRALAARRRAFREVAIARSFTHPCLPRTFGADVSSDGEPFVVMENLRGTDVVDLAEVAAADFDVRCVLGIFRQVFDALAAAHGAAIIHRNLKPPHLFCELSGRVRILSWGSATLPDDPATLDELDVSTHEWECPAARRRVRVDAADDIYSAGAMLLSLLGDEAPSGPQDASLYMKAHAMASELMTDPTSSDAASLRGQIDAWLSPLHLSGDGAAMSLVRDVVEVVWQDRALSAELEWQRDDGVKEAFARVDELIATRSTEGPSSPMTRVRLGEAAEAFVAASGDSTADIEIQVEADRLTMRDRIVWLPGPGGRIVVNALYSSGIRWLKIRAGLEDSEALLFARFLGQTAWPKPESRTDAWLELWRLELENITTNAVDVARLLTVHELEDAAMELKRLRHQSIAEPAGEDGARLGDTLFPWLDSSCWQHLDSSWTDGLDVNEVSVARLLGELLVSSTHPEEADGLLAAWDTWVVQLALSDEAHRLPDALAEVGRHLPAKEAARRVASAMRESRVMDAFLRACVRAFPEDSERTASVIELLALINFDDFGVIAEVVGSAQNQTWAGALRKWLRAHRVGNERRIGDALPRVSEAGGLELLKTLDGLDTTSAAVAARSGFESRYLSVILGAMKWLDRLPTSQVAPTVTRLLQATSGEKRQAIIERLGELGIAAVFDSLEAWLWQEEFLQLPLVERQLTLSATVQIDSNRGEELLDSIVAAEGIFAGPEAERTRVLAADLLAEWGTERSLKRLRSLTGVRFWTKRAVREHARDAIEQIKRRTTGEGNE